MHSWSARTIVAVAIASLALAAGIGVLAYNMGVAQGLAQNGRVLTAPPAGPYVYVSPRPWGFGFGFLFPFFFVAFWFFIVRSLFWGRRWGGAWHRSAVPPMFEEWHRRAHAQAGQSPSQGIERPAAEPTSDS
jgi:hypothetical protein